MRRGDDIPPVSDYAHWNEDAYAMWYEENKYDMQHADELMDEEFYDREDHEPDEDPFSDSFETEEQAREFGASLSDSPKAIGQWPPGTGLWYVDHFDEEGHKRWLNS